MVSNRDIALFLGIVVAAFIAVSLIAPMLPEFGIYFREIIGGLGGTGTIELRGYVYSEVNSADLFGIWGVSGATVKIYDQKNNLLWSGVTDSNGNFESDEIPYSICYDRLCYKVTASKEGYDDGFDSCRYIIETGEPEYPCKVKIYRKPGTPIPDFPTGKLRIKTVYKGNDVSANTWMSVMFQSMQIDASGSTPFTTKNLVADGYEVGTSNTIETNEYGNCYIKISPETGYYKHVDVVAGQTTTVSIELSCPSEECHKECKSRGYTKGTCQWCGSPDVDLGKDNCTGAWGGLLSCCCECRTPSCVPPRPTTSSCQGTPHPCSYYNIKECEFYGCTKDYASLSCTGTPYPCSHYTDCDDCYWAGCSAPDCPTTTSSTSTTTSSTTSSAATTTSSTTTSSTTSSTSTTTTQTLFTYSNFNCNDNTKICSMSYNNQAGEPILIVLHLLKNQEIKQTSFGRVAIGSSAFNSPPFSCGYLASGQYNVMFQVFKESDTTYKTPIESPTESKTITCP